MSNLSKLSASQISSVTRSPLRLTKRYGGHSATMLPTLRSSLALLMALLLPCWQVESLAQQQAAPMQLGHPGQDYSGQLQSDDPAYSPQQAYPAVAPTYQTPQASPYQEQTYPQQSNPQAIQPLAADRLQQLVAPIALYPDSLIGLLLTASTYPAQVQDADAWLHSQGNVPSEQIAAGANVQNWDPSVKALTAFPQVLALMDQNLPWTTDLGTAYFNQPSDVLEAVQVMRARAQAAGNLQPTLQEAVNYVDGNIQVAPVNPQVVYVPAYNPWNVYGQPVSPYPGFSLAATLGSIGSFIGSAAIHWGPGIAMTGFTGMPWGLLAWGVSWLVQAILFHNSNYYSNSTAVADWGFPNGGPRAWQGSAGGGNSYARTQGGYNSAPAYGSLHRPPSSYNYAHGGYTTGPNNVLVHRPPNVAQANVPRPPSSYARGSGTYSAAPGRGLDNQRSTYSGYRTSQAPTSRGSQGSGYPRGVQQSRVAPNVPRPPTLSARAQSPTFGQRSSSGFGSRGYSVAPQTQARSSGLHGFGSGQRSASFHAPKSESFHAPKMKAPKSYGGGHSGGGGHFGGGHSGGGGKHHH